MDSIEIYKLALEDAKRKSGNPDVIIENVKLVEVNGKWIITYDYTKE